VRDFTTHTVRHVVACVCPDLVANFHERETAFDSGAPLLGSGVVQEPREQQVRGEGRAALFDGAAAKAFGGPDVLLDVPRIAAADKDSGNCLAALNMLWYV